MMGGAKECVRAREKALREVGRSQEQRKLTTGSWPERDLKTQADSQREELREREEAIEI